MKCRKTYVADLHCDTVYRIGENGLFSIENSHLDLQKMKSANYSLQTFAAFVDTAHTTDGWAKCLSLIETLRCEIEKNSSVISLLQKGEDLEKNMARGLMTALLSVEEGGVIGTDISRIKILYDLGVRMMTLTWNHKNTLASPAFDCDRNTSEFSTSEGLTPFGLEAISEMEALGITVDVSHLSDRGFCDVAENTRRPFIASHSNARRLCPVPRNLTDDMIKTIGSRGGLIGLNYYAAFVGCSGGFDQLSHHAIHIAKKGGVDCLALGSDFDGIEDNPLIPNCTVVPDFRRNLSCAGFTEDEIDKIMYGNVKRFIEENM